MSNCTIFTSEPLTVTAIAAIPIYGRSADNIRDHRHVTSLLHRAYTTEYGVHVTPTLSFDERGHQKNDWTYYVEGMTAEGEAPESFLSGAGSLHRARWYAALAGSCRLQPVRGRERKKNRRAGDTWRTAVCREDTAGRGIL